MKEIKDERLSYSSGSLLKNCENRYFHYKVNKTPIDKDASDSTEAFNQGKAFHSVLEDTMHQMVENLTAIVENKCKEEDCEGEELRIEAMARKYLELNEMSGLRAIFCEYEIKTEKFIGYVDVIMSDILGNWWIVDLKTAARVSATLASRLMHDTQLNLYGSFAPMIAKDLDLDIDKFLGMRYRVTTKSKLIRKTTESSAAYIKRVMGNIKSYDIAIPSNMEIMKSVRMDHARLWDRAKELREGACPSKNRTYCDSYFRPCPYWSQCYRHTYTECESKIAMKTIDDYKEELKEVEDIL